LANEGDTADFISAMVPMLTTALSLPTSPYYCVTMAAISEIYSKHAYSSKLHCSIAGWLRSVPSPRGGEGFGELSLPKL